MLFYDKQVTIPKLPIGFINRTWRNDVSPHFEKEFGGYIIEIWINYDNPEFREVPGQYLIGIKEKEECEFIEFYEFSRENFSEKELNEISRIFWKETFKLMKKYS